MIHSLVFIPSCWINNIVGRPHLIHNLSSHQIVVGKRFVLQLTVSDLFEVAVGGNIQAQVKEFDLPYYSVKPLYILLGRLALKELDLLLLGGECLFKLSHFISIGVLLFLGLLLLEGDLILEGFFLYPSLLLGLALILNLFKLGSKRLDLLGIILPQLGKLLI